MYCVRGWCVGEFPFKDYTQERSRRQIVVSSVISFVFRTVSYVFKSEEAGRPGTSDVPIFRFRPWHHTSLYLYAGWGQQWEIKPLFFFLNSISGNICQLPRDASQTLFAQRKRWHSRVTMFSEQHFLLLVCSLYSSCLSPALQRDGI